MTDWGGFVDWRLVLPPNRPSAPTLALVEQVLAPVPRERSVAVLGSTPEYRDLLARLGFHDVTVFEKSRKFKAIADELRGWPQREKVVWGGWRDTLPRTAAVFAAVLSDLTLGNVPYDERGPFFDAIARMLGSDGLLIDRVLGTEPPFLDLGALDAKYSRLPTNLMTLNDYSAEYFFCSELLAGSDIVDTSACYSQLETRYRSNSPLLRLVSQVRLVTPEGAMWYYGRPWREACSEYERALAVVQTVAEPPDSAFRGRARLIVSVPR
jgi:hypothetical protein